MTTPPTPATPTPRGLSFTAKAVLWTVLSLVLGAACGFVGTWLLKDAPFYFGFFAGWVLVGLTGLFVLAAHVGQQQEQARQERLRDINRQS